MAYKITDECIACGECEAVCPNDAISEGNTQFIIDPAKCTECVGAFSSPQCADVCPVAACVPDLFPDYAETKKQLLKKWQKFHPEKEPVVGTF